MNIHEIGKPLPDILHQASHLPEDDFRNWCRNQLAFSFKYHPYDYPVNTARIGTVVGRGEIPFMCHLDRGHKLLLIGQPPLTGKLMETILNTGIVSTLDLNAVVLNSGMTHGEMSSAASRLKNYISYGPTILMLPNLEEFAEGFNGEEEDYTHLPYSETSVYPSLPEIITGQTGSLIEIFRSKPVQPVLWDRQKGFFVKNNLTVIASLDPENSNFWNALPAATASIHYLAIQGPYIPQLSRELGSRYPILPESGMTNSRLLDNPNNLLVSHEGLDIIQPYE